MYYRGEILQCSEIMRALHFARSVCLTRQILLQDVIETPPDREFAQYHYKIMVVCW